ncbi:hypothetical protein T310_9325, partial [Rasamsonia emersonii CBS 393.64]
AVVSRRGDPGQLDRRVLVNDIESGRLLDPSLTTTVKYRRLRLDPARNSFTGETVPPGRFLSPSTPFSLIGYEIWGRSISGAGLDRKCGGGRNKSGEDAKILSLRRRYSTCIYVWT